MTVDAFFEALENQYNNQLPFVVYSRPIHSLVKCWLQNDDTLHTTSRFTESGFVFAPFDLKDDSVLFPELDSKHISIDVQSEIEIENPDLQNSDNFSEDVKDSHIELVQKGISEINNGNLEKVVLSRVEMKDCNTESPISVFKRLYNRYKKAMVYCWYHPKVGLWVGATPELLFKLEGKQLTTISLAGTQPFRRISKVSWTSKEIEEQQIVTDYIAERIQPYAKKINISGVETVRAGNLLHLKSRVTSLLKNSVHLKSIIETLHPTPAVCGFPRQEAKDFILQNENYNREFYTGFLGELNLKFSKTRNANRRNVENNAYAVVKTQSNFYVNLRCAQLKEDKILIYVGGGITKDSDPMKEWEETVNKTKTIESILN